MKYISIALFMLLFSVSVALVNESGVLGVQSPIHSEWFTELNTSISSEQYTTNVASSIDPVRATGDLVKGLALFAKIFARSIIDVPLIFQLLGVPFYMAVWLSMPIYFFYLLAIVQFMTRFRAE